MFSITAKRCLSFAMALVMLFSMLPLNALATETTDDVFVSAEMMASSETSVAIEETITLETDAVEIVDVTNPETFDNLEFVKSESLLWVESCIDTILYNYSISDVMTNADIEAAVSAMETMAYRSALWEIWELDSSEELQRLSEEEITFIQENHSAIFSFAEALDVRYATDNEVSFYATTVSVLDGKITIKDTATNMSESGGTVTVKAPGGLLSQTTNTITITNNSGTKATISFDYSANNYSSFSQSSANGTYTSSTLSAGDTITMSIKGKRAISGGTATLTLSGFSLTEAASESNVIFNYDESLGAITVNGTAVASGTNQTVSLDTGATLVAVPNSGTTFYGWINEVTHKILSTNTTYTLAPSADMSVKAIFAGGEAPNAIFKIGADYLSDTLTGATECATSTGESKIVLLNNGTLPAGNYTIPNGKTLLIPFDDAHTLYTTMADRTGTTYTKPTVYRRLTMADGAHITVNGSMSLSAKFKSGAGNKTNTGSPSGPCSFVTMNEGSSITVNGNLYVYGFITGSGTITANSTATVYENFQFMDWRGGDQTTGMKNEVFPISQYYIQNIEVPLTLNAGASIYCPTAVSVQIIGDQKTAVKAFGSSDAMFIITSGSVTKRYDGSKDRLHIDVNGNMQISTAKITLGIYSVSSDDYILPLNQNITVEVNGGSSVSINQDVALLPGAEILIHENATCTLAKGKRMYVYDADQWGKYCGASNKTFYPIEYAPGKSYTRSDADLVDAKVMINGVADASAGYLYTTAGGANIYSTKGGTLKTQKGTETVTYQIIQAGDKNNSQYPEIPITPAKLKNADGSYLSSGTNTYTYADGAWRCATHTTEEGKHKCEVCGFVTPCVDTNPADHKCDICDKTVSECKDNDSDSICDICGASLCDHNYQPVVTEPTCESGGYTTYTCSACGHSYTDNEVDALGHSYSVTATTSSTCTTAGSKTYTCGACGDSYSEALSIDDTAHSWNDTPSAYVADGEDCVPVYTCKYNNEHTKQEEPASHDYENFVCKNCGDKQKFTITWIVDGESTTAQVAYGETPAYDGTPTKDTTAQYTYAFAGWSPEVVAVEDDATYTANFTPTIRSYTVKFVSEGNTLQKETLEYGATPEFKGDEPTKIADKQYTYTFKGWDKGITTVTGDVTYTATFDATVKTYTVKFVNEDGTELQSSAVEYGETPAYTGETPTKAADAQYTYTFAGWSPAIAEVTGDATYKATYSSSVNEYTITFVNEDGTELQSGKVAYGNVPSYTGATPTKEATNQYTYTFDKWDTEPVAVTGDATYTATFNEILRKYTVTFQDHDGRLLASNEMSYGEIPSYGGTPTKAADAQYTYTFTGWSPAITAVTGDVTYTATYTETLRSYTVKFVDEDGTTVLQSTEVAYGETPVYKGGTPTKAATAQYTYKFAGWDNEIAAVTGAVTYKATYTSTVNKYTVTWIADGTTIATEEVEYGSNATAHDVPEKPGHTGKWESEGKNITANTTINAVYTANTYTVTWLNYNGNLYKTTEVAFGAEITALTDPPTKAKSGCTVYTFSHWDGLTDGMTMPDKNLTFTAVFTGEEKHTITNVPAQPATCDAIGWEAYEKCSNCDYTTCKEIAALGHDYNDHEAKAPTCTEVGWEAYQTCSRCDYTTYVEQAANGHTAGEPVVENNVAATCTADGSYDTVVYCTVCDAEISRKTTTVPANGHTAGELVVENNVAATCTTEGSHDEVVYCTVCGAEISRNTIVDQVLGHTEVIDKAVDPTCTRNGLTEGKHCSVCNTVLVKQETVDATGHQNLSYTDNGDGTHKVTCACTAVVEESETHTYDETTHQCVCGVIQKFTVTFTINGETYGDPISVEFGAAVTAPEYEAPAGHTFSGWTVPETMPDENITLNATQTVNKYTVKFVNDDGTVLQNSQVAYGTTPVYAGATPTKAADAQYTYSFQGWNVEIADVTGDVTYTATYTETLRKYTVKFVGEDGTTELHSAEFEYGTKPEYTGDTPTKADDEQFTYTFSGWTPELTEVTGEATYTAVFTAEEIKVYVAQVGDTKYETLTDAIDAAAENGEITLLANVTEEITVNKAVTIVKNGYTAVITAGDGFEVEETDTGYVVSVAEEPVAKCPYDIGQQTQVYLVEPWALRAKLNLYHFTETGGRGSKLTASEIAQFQDYGIYFLRASDRQDDAVEITAEEILNSAKTSHYSKNDSARPASVDSGNSIYADYREGVYTYQFADSIYVLCYFTNDNGTYYAEVRERNLRDIINTEKQKTNIDQKYIAMYTAMSNMEADFSAYIANYQGDPPALQKAPTLATYSLPYSDSYIKFSHTWSISLVEPWGIQLTGYISGDKDYDEYGFMVFYDVNGVVPDSASITVEDLMTTYRNNTYVFSSANGDVTLSKDAKGRHQIVGIYNKGIYTYQMDSNAYVVYYVKDSDGYHYGDIKVRNIIGNMETFISKATSASQKKVMEDILEMYNAAKNL